MCVCSSCVRAVTSKQSGMGKSLFIERMERNLLQNLKAVGSARVVIPIHGPTVSPDTVLEALRGYNTPEYDNYIFHFDIAPGVSRLLYVGTVLFIQFYCLDLVEGGHHIVQFTRAAQFV